MLHTLAKTGGRWRVAGLFQSSFPISRNPRKNDHAIDRIATSINEFGLRSHY